MDPDALGRPFPEGLQATPGSLPHAEPGEGNPLAGYPALAGQHAVYTEKMLKGFRAGTNWGEEDANSKIMTDVANRLTDDEIKAVASYIQGLHSAE